MKKIDVSWEDVEEYINKAVEYIKKRGLKPTGVYGVPRGGLILATLLSYRLNLPLLMATANGCIIIDDIADSGRTLMHFTENDTQFNKYEILTMYYHKRSVVKPNFYMFEKENEWINFPWEKEDL